MEKRDKLYEGKAKIVYATSKPGTVVQYFKDDATAFNALKRGTIVGKGEVNNQMSATLFRVLEKAASRRTTSPCCPPARCLPQADIIKIKVIPATWWRALAKRRA
jgi:phosphoribosylaminoimidazole-succinocarboxamide synthase